MNIRQIIREEMDGLNWIKDEELPILPYIGKRFKLIRDDGQDSGRRYQILEYYFEDKYNKDFYIKSIILNPETLKPETKKFGSVQGQIFHTPISRAMELINDGNWVFLDTINESQDDFDWAKGDAYFTIDDIIGKQIYYRKNNLSDLENKGISLTDLNRGDVELGDIRWSDGWVVEKVLENNMCLLLLDKGKTTAYKKESVESYVNLGTWVLVDQNGNILNDFKNKNIREEIDDFGWIRDSNPIEAIDLNDEWHVNTIKEGDKLEITGKYDGIEFYNEPCEVVCVSTCSYRKTGNAWNHQILVSFEREFYSEEMDEETHCGPDSRSEEKCNCEVYAMDRYGEAREKGTCWWIHVTYLDEVVRINAGGINESEKILESLFNKLSILTEDGKTEPDMEWDFTKGELDKSKSWVKTKEDVKKYLTLLFDKMRRIPKKVKLNILKYVLASFVGILTVSELTKVVEEVSDGKIILNKPTEKIIEPEVVKVERIRKPSDSLIDFLKDEEGYSDEGYNIGDGKITIGWGHAEDIGDSQYEVGQKISKQEAEKLLRQDVKVASDALNRILDKWESDGIKVDINQDMYDVMTSMLYNMGIGSFRMSDFIQMVKRGEMEKAKEEIKSVSSQMFNKYPGLKKRRKKESEMFNLV